MSSIVFRPAYAQGGHESSGAEQSDEEEKTVKDIRQRETLVFVYFLNN